MDGDLDPMQQLDEYGDGSSFGAEDEAMILWQGGGVEAVGEAKVRPCGGRVDFVSDDFPQPLAAAASAELRGGTFPQLRTFEQTAQPAWQRPPMRVVIMRRC